MLPSLKEILESANDWAKDEPGSCFACGKRLSKTTYPAITSDGQKVFVGSDCWDKIMTADKQQGYQPPKGGPRLFPNPKRSA